MWQRLSDVIAVQLACPTDIEIGQVVEISDDLTVQAVSGPSGPIVGTVCVHTDRDLEHCTIETHFRERRDDRLAAVDGVAVGWFVFDADGKVVNFSGASPAIHEGTATGPCDPTLDTDDKVKVKVDGTSYTVQLTAGTDVTFATIAAEINAGVTGATAVVDAAGHINLVANQIGKTVEVEAVANDAYTLLGWTAAIYYPTNASHDPSCIRGLVIKGGDADEALDTLEY